MISQNRGFLHGAIITIRGEDIINKTLNMVQEAGLSKKETKVTRAAYCDLLSGGGDKGSLSFFSLTLFFGGLVQV